MRWRKVKDRSQVEDRRGRGGAGGLPIPMGKAGAGGLGLIGLIIAIVLGSGVLGGGDGGGFGIDPELNPFPELDAQADDAGSTAPDPEEELVDFVNFVVVDVQDSWARAFAEADRQYQETQLVLFEDTTTTACGNASSATGPFYCPPDAMVYLDLGFFRELNRRFGAPGDFAQAYVIAHEFGHHVQNVLGINEDVRRQQQEDPASANELSIRLELQADCLAGVWTHSAYEENQLSPGDLDEGLTAAASVGDDRIQAQSGGGVNPETWTHGSSEQRVEWFRRGFESGAPSECDTFAEDEV